MATTWGGEEITEADIRKRLQRPRRGASVLAQEEAEADAEKKERKVKALVKARDQFRCRWPEKHVCRKGFEAAHIVDASRGGAMATENLVGVCGWIHRRGPESIHGKQLKVEKETTRGADGPLSFWRQTGEFDALGQPTYFLVAREISPFRVEKD